MVEKCPFMSKFARKYLAVQGTSTPAEQVISRFGTILTKTKEPDVLYHANKKMKIDV